MRGARLLGIGAAIAILLLAAGNSGQVRTVAAQADCNRTVYAGDSIQRAIDNAKPGEIVCVRAGTYQEGLTINKPITLRGEGQGRVTIVGSISVTNAVNVTLQGFTLQGGRGLVVFNSSSVTLIDLAVIGSEAAGVMVNNSSVQVSQCLISGNKLQGMLVALNSSVVLASTDITKNGGDGLAASDSNAEIRGSRVTENQGVGMRLNNSSVQVSQSLISGNKLQGVLVALNSSVALASTDITKNGGDGLAVSASKAEMRLNFITENQGCGVKAEGATLTGGSNVIRENAGGNLCGAPEALLGTPLPAPTNLRINTQDWTNQPQLDWDNPAGAEVGAAWYKLEREPQHRWDGIRTTQKPIKLENLPEGERSVVIYLWLEDENGLADPRNRAQGTFTVRIDRTPPRITATLNPPRPSSGWYTTDVTVSFQCEDALSGVASCSSPVTVSQEVKGLEVRGEAVDKAGNRAERTVTVNLDKTKPQLTLGEPQGTLGSEGWYRTDVVVPYTATDNLAGFSGGQRQLQGSVRSSGEGSAVKVRVRVEDLAGNATEAEAGPFKVDQTPPTIRAAVNPQPNAQGWNNTDVTVRFECSDALSGLVSCTPQEERVTSEGEHRIEGRAEDRAGNVRTTSVTVRLDKTPPTGSLTINDGAATTGSTIVTLKIQANDNLSGVAEMRFSNDGRTWSDWESFRSTRSNWDLARYGGSVNQRGPKTVYAQLRDRAGNVSQTFSATIRLIATTLIGHTWSVWSVAFSPDGRLLASGSGDETIKLWEVATGREVRTLTGHTNDVTSVAFSPDGRLLASGSTDKTIKLWEVASGRKCAPSKATPSLSGPWRSAPTGSSSPPAPMTGRSAVGGGHRQRSAHPQRPHQRCHFRGVQPRRAAPGLRLRDTTIKLWDVATGREVRTLTGHTDWVNSVAFSPDGRLLASGSGDETIKLWDVATGREVRTLTGHTDYVKSVAFSPNGKLLASGSRTGRSSCGRWPQEEKCAPSKATPALSFRGVQPRREAPRLRLLWRDQAVGHQRSSRKVK
jgi:WD40 repeat protein